MNFTLNLRPERRLSFKILAHKVRAHLPWAYSLLLWLRYATFARECKNLGIPSISYSDGSWINRKTTTDLLAIEQHLKATQANGRLLQIGIGNSSLYAVVGQQFEQFVGITVVEDEIAHAKAQYGHAPNYQFQLFNKYSTELLTLAGPFDYIIDNDISSYACCHHHFNDLLASYARLLTPAGVVMVGHKGLGYFDSGFGLTPAKLASLAAPHGLELTDTPACYVLKHKQAGGPGRT